VQRHESFGHGYRVDATGQVEVANPVRVQDLLRDARPSASRKVLAAERLVVSEMVTVGKHYLTDPALRTRAADSRLDFGRPGT